MTPADWDNLQSSLEKKGLAIEGHPDSSSTLHAWIARQNHIEPDIALEWLANQYDILPFSLPRPTCSTQAEGLFHTLARTSTEQEPWLPFGTLGPLLMMAHYNPASEQFWQIPPELVLRILVPHTSYEALHADIFQRIRINPLSSDPPLVPPRPMPKAEGILGILGWLLEFYPFSHEDHERIERNFEQLQEANVKRWRDFKVLPRGCNIALNYLALGDLCFNADQAPPQDYFPDALMEKHLVYPLHIGKKEIYLLSEDRYNFAFEDEWLSRGNDPIEWRPVLSDRESILAAIARNRGRSASSQSTVMVGDLAYSDVENLVEIDDSEVQRINPSNINTTPEQVIHWVLYNAIAGRASDLHVEKYYNTARFRVRIDGELKTIHSCPEEALPRFVSLVKNYANMGQRRQDAQDARFSMSIGKRRIDCRVSAIPCRKDQQKLTIRFLDKLDGVKKLTELNLASDQLKTLQQVMGRDQGLILITGPTGSGKTTTLYALLNSVNSENINIHTIEDPIEYEIEGLNQTQTDPVNGIDFPEGLRRLMRADPDVILIGECRDEETATAAINAALTGHLVLTTLHANDCLRAVSRLIAMGIPPYLLADSLALTQAQRLVRRLCTYCKRPAPITPELTEILNVNRIPIPDNIQAISAPVGCPECRDTGYSGRIALMEMCPVDSRLADLVAANAPQSEMRAMALERGILTLYQHGLIQVLQGNTSLDEIACLSYASLRNFNAL